MRNAHCKTWNMARKLKITENEKYTLGSEIWRGKLKEVENLEMSTVVHGICKKSDNHKNDKHPLYDLKNDEITEKREK